MPCFRFVPSFVTGLSGGPPWMARTGTRAAFIVERVDGHDPGHAARHAARGVERHRSAHGVSDQHHSIELQRQDHGLDVAAKARHRPLRPVRSRGAMAAQIDGHDPVLLRERFDLLAPEGAVAGPAVEEYQRGLPLAADVVGDGETVGGPRRPLLHAGRPGGGADDEGGQGREDHFASSPGLAVSYRRS